jgi:hypothetical protein
LDISNLSGSYRIVLDETWNSERPEIRRPDRRWYEQIPCRGGGFIYLYAEEPPTLGLYTPLVKSARSIFEKIKAIPGVRADFHYDGEAVLYFPPEILPQVPELAGARKKRRGRKLTAVERTKLVAAGLAYRFKDQLPGRQGENLAEI